MLEDMLKKLPADYTNDISRSSNDADKRTDGKIVANEDEIELLPQRHLTIAEEHSIDPKTKLDFGRYKDLDAELNIWLRCSTQRKRNA